MWKLAEMLAILSFCLGEQKLRKKTFTFSLSFFSERKTPEVWIWAHCKLWTSITSHGKEFHYLTMCCVEKYLWNPHMMISSAVSEFLYQKRKWAPVPIFLLPATYRPLSCPPSVVCFPSWVFLVFLNFPCLEAIKGSPCYLCCTFSSAFQLMRW